MSAIVYSFLVMVVLILLAWCVVLTREIHDARRYAEWLDKRYDEACAKHEELARENDLLRRLAYGDDGAPESGRGNGGRGASGL